MQTVHRAIDSDLTWNATNVFSLHTIQFSQSNRLCRTIFADIAHQTISNDNKREKPAVNIKPAGRINNCSASDNLYTDIVATFVIWMMMHTASAKTAATCQI